MPKFQCPECGSRLKSSQSLEGRMVTCPQCGKPTILISVPVPPPLPDPNSSAPAVDDAAQANDVQDSQSGPAKTVRRRKPLMISIGGIAAVSVIVIVWFVVQAKEQERINNKILQEDADQALLAEMNRKAKEEQQSKTEPLRINENDLPLFLSNFFQANVLEILSKNENASGITVRDVEVSRVNNPRMIDWLWKVRGNVAYAVTEKKGNIPERIAFTWTSLYYLTPDLDSSECWRELVGIEDGSRLWKRVGRSPWKKEVRDEIRNKWLKEMRDYDARYTDSDEESRLDRLRSFRDRKEILAKGLGISIEEFDDILKSID